MNNDTFSTMSDLARVIGNGSTSHSVGRELTRLGLRSDGKPTSKAHELGLVKSASTDRGDAGGYFYVWHKQKTLGFLRPNAGGEGTP
jgi:hypothetical protein